MRCQTWRGVEKRRRIRRVTDDLYWRIMGANDPATGFPNCSNVTMAGERRGTPWRAPTGGFAARLCRIKMP